MEEKKERKMRDSGIPWIGEVPEGWELVPLKYLLSNEVNSLKVGPFGSQLSGTDCSAQINLAGSQKRTG